MSLLNTLRNYSFWILDYLKGGKIRQHYKDIETILSHPASQTSRLKQSKQLEALLKHATESTLFYKNFIGFKNIKDFPIIKKTIIQDHFESFKSENYKGLKHYKVSTSGSTGVPFFLFQDLNKRNRNTADVIFFSKQSDYIIGNKLYELEVWRKHNKKGKLKSFLQNVYQFDVSRLTDDKVHLFIRALRSSKSSKSILGFSSALEGICKYLDKTHELVANTKIKSIIANSEYLNDYTRQALKKHFKTPVFSRYSSEEIGIIAQQTLKSGNHFIINHASYYLELLKFEDDTPADIGEYGRIIVTDLFNYNMPIIRYDTGDVAKAILDQDGIMRFEHIEGRKMDIVFDANGNLMSSFVIYTMFYPFYSLLKQYQFIQTGKKEYLIKLNIHDEFPFEDELIESFKIEFGDEADIKIEYVDEIPPLASGKRKKVVNLYSS